LDQSAPIGVLLLWAATTMLGTALVRQLPRVLK